MAQSGAETNAPRHGGKEPSNGGGILPGAQKQGLPRNSGATWGEQNSIPLPLPPMDQPPPGTPCGGPALLAERFLPTTGLSQGHSSEPQLGRF